MGWILGVFLIISVPIFYIYGLAIFIKDNFIKKSSHKKSQDQQKRVLLKLKLILKNDPQISLKQAMYFLKTKSLDDLKSQTNQSVNESISSEEIHTQKDQSNFSNWYSDNSITVLLYVGAFLIVSATSIFISFQWDSFSGVFKSILVTLFNLTWILAGLVFIKHKKLKTAGTTFLAIGAILIPISGLAWNQFAFKSNHIGLVWLVTSFFACVSYLLLAQITKTKNYLYLLATAGLSLLLSLNKIAGYQPEMYVLTMLVYANISSFIYTPLYKKFKDQRMVISNFNAVLVPISLLFGASLADEKLFSLQAILALILGVIFYLSEQYRTKNNYFVIPANLLCYLITLDFLHWQQVDTKLIIYGVQFQTATFACLGLLLTKTRKRQLSKLILSTSLVVSVLNYLISLGFNLSHIDYSLLVLLTATYSLSIAIWFSENNIRYLFSALLYLVLYHLLQMLLEPQLILGSSNGIAINNNLFPSQTSNSSLGKKHLSKSWINRSCVFRCL